MCRANLWITTLVVLSAMAGSPGAHAQTVIYVDAAATGANDGSSWTDAYLDLQLALGGAVAGDELWVATGTYYPGALGEVAATFQLISGVALYGGFAGNEAVRDQRDVAANETILSGDIGQDDSYGGGVCYVGWDLGTDNSTHIITANGTDLTAVLDGFTVMAGQATSAFGAGMYNVGGSPTVRNCIFRCNLAAFGSGAGIYNQDGSPAITDCTFAYNYVHLGRGGGIYNYGASQPLIEDCTFVGNKGVGGGSTESMGAGIANAVNGPITITRCRFEGNRVDPFYAQGDYITRGAGIHHFSGTLTVDGCVFTDNFAHAGAGLFTWDETTVVNSIFMNNVVVSYPVQPPIEDGGYGGAIASTSAQADTTTLINCVLANNHAGEAGGAFSGWNHNTVIRNSILWGNTATGEEVPTVGAQFKGSADVLYSCVEGLLETIPGEDPPNPDDFPGSIDADPLLVNVAGYDVRVAAGSPCIDAGDNDAVPAWLATDYAGGARFVDDPAAPDTGNPGTAGPPVVDMGAFEYGVPGGAAVPAVSTWGAMALALLVVSAATIAFRRLPSAKHA